jgi:hypothetical protein
MAATTAMLNAPVRPAHIGAPKSDQPADPNAASIPPSTPPAPTPGTPPSLPPSTPPDAPTGSPAPTGDKPATPDAATPAGGVDEADEDPYEGIAPEDLPPDMQYDADSSVSFPTNI